VLLLNNHCQEKNEAMCAESHAIWSENDSGRENFRRGEAFNRKIAEKSRRRRRKTTLLGGIGCTRSGMQTRWYENAQW
jgi:hypothetical protein